MSVCLPWLVPALSIYTWSMVIMDHDRWHCQPLSEARPSPRPKVLSVIHPNTHQLYPPFWATHDHAWLMPNQEWRALTRSNVMWYCVIKLSSIDPKDLPSNMRHFPRISQNSLKISSKFRANVQIQSLTYAHLFIEMESYIFAIKRAFHWL